MATAAVIVFNYCESKTVGCEMPRSTRVGQVFVHRTTSSKYVLQESGDTCILHFVRRGVNHQLIGLVKLFIGCTNHPLTTNQTLKEKRHYH